MTVLMGRGEIRASKGPAGAPRDPALAEWLGAGAASVAGQVVTSQTSLQASAVYACVRNTAETMASMPCVLKRATEGETGRRRTTDATEHPLYHVLLREPNEWQTAFDFWGTAVEHLQLRGNFYARIRRNGSGQTVALDPLHPDRVTPYWTRNRRPAYEHRPTDGPREILLAGEVLHVRGPLQGDGLKGASPITLHRETVGMALASRDYGARLFRNDARPSGVLEMDGTLDDEPFQRLKDGWQDAYGGVNRHNVAILEHGAKYRNIGMTNEDAQYLETRGFTDVEIARLFRVPPHKIGIKSQMTLNNIEHQNREWVTDTLMPVARRIEDPISRDLLTARGRRTLFARFDFGELLRGDVKAQTEAHTKGIQWGYYCPNDVRERMQLNPIGPEGDVYLTPVNMQAMTALLPDSDDERDDDET